MDWIRPINAVPGKHYNKARKDEDVALEVFFQDQETKRWAVNDIPLSEIPHLESPLVVVFIRAQRAHWVGISRKQFNSLLDSFAIDRRVQSALHYTWHGSYHRPSEACRAYFLSTFWGKTIWAPHDHDSKLTRGICLGQDPARAEFDKTVAILQTELTSSSSALCTGNLLLPWAVITAALLSRDEDQRELFYHIRMLEKYTDHNVLPERYADVPQLQDLSEASKRAGHVIFTSDLARRELSGLLPAIDDLILCARGEKRDRAVQGPTTEEEVDDDDKSERIVASFQFLREMAEGIIDRVSVDQKRGEIVSPVIQALISHQDASTAHDLAKASHRIGEESKKLAEQSTKDAASMKTIAIMTMAFLPGTYLAALFALPSLAGGAADNSDSENNDTEGVGVMEDGRRVTTDFRLYWAITLPVTAAIFLVWYALNLSPKRRRELFYMLGRFKPKKSSSKV